MKKNKQKKINQKARDSELNKVAGGATLDHVGKIVAKKGTPSIIAPGKQPMVKSAAARKGGKSLTFPKK